MIPSMKKYQVVIDTNIIYAALKSSKGVSYKLLKLIGGEKFGINISVPMILEYEDVAKRLLGEIPLIEEDIDDIIDYICSIAKQWEIHYLWRPFLKDPKDDMVLELAVSANCDYIITYNQRDFQGSEKFSIEIITPKDFLQLIEEI
jgi:putative PIN family toxin of toxin-antitoxin system